jgi:hypothetical protein
VDRPVVGEERVRDAAEPLERVVVAVGDRLVGDVAAGQHDRCAGGVREQVVQRGAGQHEPELPVAGRDRGGDRRARPAIEQHDGPAPVGEQPGGHVADLAQSTCDVHIGHQERERLVLAVFAAAQLGRGLLVLGQDGEVVVTEPLDRDDPPGVRQGGRLGDRVAGLVRAVRAQPQPRAAVGAARRLRVEAPVRRVVVLRRAGRAHGEAGHRGERTVVGHVADDRDPGPARARRGTGRPAPRDQCAPVRG